MKWGNYFFFFQVLDGNVKIATWKNGWKLSFLSNRKKDEKIFFFFLLDCGFKNLEINVLRNVYVGSNSVCICIILQLIVPSHQTKYSVCKQLQLSDHFKEGSKWRGRKILQHKLIRHLISWHLWGNRTVQLSQAKRITNYAHDHRQLCHYRKIISHQRLINPSKNEPRKWNFLRPKINIKMRFQNKNYFYCTFFERNFYIMKKFQISLQNIFTAIINFQIAQ